MTKHQTIKKPILSVEVHLPKATKRADVVPSNGPIWSQMTFADLRACFELLA